ncbi:gamma-aminobutyric acid type B receptor subunit 2-like [Ptychodera flava]|uniref:gamma-aminobutyric acid type B receptor subunit 2-like n=1 Tax=Ptychodera flava TaxID=63121 RepID=UPI003969DCA3
MLRPVCGHLAFELLLGIEVFVLAMYSANGMRNVTHGNDTGVVASQGNDTNLLDLFFAAMLPLTTGRPESRIANGVKPAIELALRHVNSNGDILPGYKLNMELYDTKCDMAVGTKAFFDAMATKPKKFVVLGGICSNVTAPIAETVSWWKLTQISFANKEPFLSEREKYPTFFRTVPSEADFNPAKLKLLEYFNWTRIASIHQNTPTFELAHSKLATLLEDTKVHLAKVTNFDRDPTLALQKIKESGVRIILGFFDNEVAPIVFCQIYRQRLFGDKYVWILPGWSEDNWWNSSRPATECSVDEIVEAANGFLATDLLHLSASPEHTISGFSADEYRRQYDTSRGDLYHSLHSYAYDSVWVIATALHRVAEKVENISALLDVDDESNAFFDLFEDAMNQTEFTGVTGPLRFNCNGDRLGTILLRQFQDDKTVQIGEYNAFDDTISLLEYQVFWSGGFPPRDRPIIHHLHNGVSLLLYIGLCSLSYVGIMLALLFLFFNMKFRNYRYIKMSSPYINNLIIGGAALCYSAIFFLGLDGRYLAQNNFDVVCALRAWLLALGFTLAYGAMFAKTWRVHSIFTNIRLKKKSIKDSKLFGIVGALVFVDLLILISWGINDPLKRVEHYEEPQPDPRGRDISIIPIMQHCKSNRMTIWLSVIYVYKGILLVFGCFLAWETRRVSIPALNDSKYIGMSVYNVVVMCTTGAALSFFMPNNPDASFGLIALFILFCTTITLCLVFIPKLLQLRRDPHGEDGKIRCTNAKSSYRVPPSVCTVGISMKFQQLKAENIELNRILAEKDSEISLLLEKLKPNTSTETDDEVKTTEVNHVTKTESDPAFDQNYVSYFVGITNSPKLPGSVEKGEKAKPTQDIRSIPTCEIQFDPPQVSDSLDSVNSSNYQTLEKGAFLEQLLPLLKSLRETAILSDSEDTDPNQASTLTS